MNKYTPFPISLPGIKVLIIPQLEDNYTYLIPYENKALLIDPVEHKLYDFLKEKNLELTHILTTHHHSDHVAANNYLKKMTGCQIIGPNDSRIPGLTRKVRDLEAFSIGPFIFKVIATPGHTKSHVVYLLDKVLFSGDTLFGAGCGRIFEGSYEEMFSSLEKLCFLEDDTLIFCGHEYTQKNLQFAISLDDKNISLKKRYEETKRLLENNQPSIPFTLETEKATNPFLRAVNPKEREYNKVSKQDALNTFKTLRETRDRF